jgi:ferric-dicitrate binding protein FerR (iron transport regulator)
VKRSRSVDEFAQRELLERASNLARSAFSDEVSPAEEREAKRRLVLALGVPRKTSRRGVWLAAALVAAVAVATLFVVFRPAPDLAYRIESASNDDSGYVQALAGGPRALAHFSDGTDVAIAPGGRARIVDVTPHGARLALEQGRATLHVVHLPGARWSVDAGPFSIAVTGTVFDADWSGEGGVLQVDLRVGSVVVAGPLSPEGIGLHAGQRLIANLQEKKLRIEPLPVDGSVASTAPVSPAANPPAASVDAPALATETANDGPAETASGDANGFQGATWPKRVASGDFASVLAEAKSRGLPTTLAHGKLSDLVALGDAARYTGNLGIARHALEAQRSRFAATIDAKAAAFYLGRLAEDRGSLGEAIRYYDAYLSEAPRGSFAAEASGRKMLATRRASGDGAARALAEAYLARFPKGPYANVARELAPPP